MRWRDLIKTCPTSTKFKYLQRYFFQVYSHTTQNSQQRKPPKVWLSINFDQVLSSLWRLRFVHQIDPVNLRLNLLLGPQHFYMSKYKERTSNNTQSFIQHGLLPFYCCYCLSQNFKAARAVFVTSFFLKTVNL